MSTTAVRTIEHRIAGRATARDSHRTAPVWDPATGEQQAEVLLAEPSDVDAAVAAAKAAFETWGDVSLSRRSTSRGQAINVRWPEEAQDPAHHAGHMHFPTAV